MGPIQYGSRYVRSSGSSRFPPLGFIALRMACLAAVTRPQSFSIWYCLCRSVFAVCAGLLANDMAAVMRPRAGGNKGRFPHYVATTRQTGEKIISHKKGEGADSSAIQVTMADGADVGVADIHDSRKKRHRQTELKRVPVEATRTEYNRPAR